ncbi:MAG TPA: class C beta-lactamase-related serine hydrolase, partial [Gammaproteobacteria bacterium]|nr:class C beta-lactamase-related serine hydrolase [Gammaproteobacteria bacterium]
FKIAKWGAISIVALSLISCGDNPSISESLTINEKENSLYTDLIWEEATPTNVGIDPVLLENSFIYALADETYTQAVIVIKDEKLIYEKYRGLEANELGFWNQSLTERLELGVEIPQELQDAFINRDRYSLATSWSTAKSFVGILIGIAIDQGYIQSVDESASTYITEWSNDNRNQITIRNLLDMRSGLPGLCATGSQPNYELEVCPYSIHWSGGNLTPVQNQLDACINREIAETGIIQSWYSSERTWEKDYLLYSNCEAQVLGELLFRATGKDLQSYADINLFSKIGFEGHWWRDNENNGQSNGNYLAYCCLDATARDFAKFGQLILNNGSWGNEQIVSSSYVEKIKRIGIDSVVEEDGSYYSYGMLFWTLDPTQQDDGTDFPPANKILLTAGTDGQYIILDIENNMVLVRNSLYYPMQFASFDRKMIATGDLNAINYPQTLPLSWFGYYSSFHPSVFLYLVSKSLN